MSQDRYFLVDDLADFDAATHQNGRADVECKRCPATWNIRHNNGWVATGHFRRLMNHARRHGASNAG